MSYQQHFGIAKYLFWDFQIFILGCAYFMKHLKPMIYLGTKKRDLRKYKIHNKPIKFMTRFVKRHDLIKHDL